VSTFLAVLTKKLYAIEFFKKWLLNQIKMWDSFKLFIAMTYKKCGFGTTMDISLGSKNYIKVSKGHHHGHEMNNERAILNALEQKFNFLFLITRDRNTLKNIPNSFTLELIQFTIFFSHGDFFINISTWKYGGH